MRLEDIDLESPRYPLEVLADLLEVFFESKGAPDETEALWDWLCGHSVDTLSLLRGTME